MLKRFYSKKSGFTLVEIIVAFAIFAIMAAMIVQILDLSVSARRSNNIYQRELAEQERLLTLIQRTSKDYNSTKGTISFTLGTTTIELPYDMLSAKSDALFDSEGLNYFISSVNYQASGEFSPSDVAGGGSDAGGSNTGSQAARMDTRITGTGGIGYIKIEEVIKDTTDYPEGSPYAVPAGCTRYFFRVSASSKDNKDNETLAKEDIPYSQYRLFFYDDVKLDAAASAVRFTDDKNNPYTKNVHQSLTIAQVGYVSENVDGIVERGGLSYKNFSTSTHDTYNKYTVQQSGTNAVRIGSPFEGKGVKFEPDQYSNFYVDFVGNNVTLSTASFGYNKEKSSLGSVDLGYKYSSCPNYDDSYDEDGKPTYVESGNPHVNIYGAFLYERNYNVTGTPAPDEGGDEE